MARPDLNVAPYESCVSCFKGDVDTAVCLHGEAEWIIAALHKFGDMSIDEASATFGVYAEDELGCDPGKVPGGELTYCVRLCRDCAERTGAAANLVPVAKLTRGESVPALTEPEGLRDEDSGEA